MSAPTKLITRQPLGHELPQLRDFSGSSHSYLQNLLERLVRNTRARQGIIFRLEPGKPPRRIAAVPELKGVPEWIKQAIGFVELSTTDSQVMIKPLPPATPGEKGECMMIFPMHGELEGRGFAAFLYEQFDGALLNRILGFLESALLLTVANEKRIEADKEKKRADRLMNVLHILAASDQAGSFQGTLISLCNELAARLDCSRVSIGFLEGRYIRLKAMSHNNSFTRQMQLVQSLEMVMEECFDQDEIVAFPNKDNAITRSAEDFSGKHGPVALLSLPILWQEMPYAVLTLERSNQSKFQQEEVELLKLLVEMVSPQLQALRDNDRWLGAKIGSSISNGLKTIVGPRHTGVKLATLLLVAALIYCFTATTSYQLEAGSVFVADEQRIVAAPFTGFIESIDCEPGDSVVANEDLLARLDTSELELQQGALLAELLSFTKMSDLAVSTNRMADKQLAMAKADRIKEEIRLNKFHIDQASLYAPISGTVVSEDLSKMVGARINLGEKLFTIVPLEKIYAELTLPEREIIDLQTKQEGELVAFAYPDRPIPFIVSRIYPIALVTPKGNTFKVRVELQDTPEWIRPGMTGLAKIHIREAQVAWVWTRKFRHWLRLHLWI